MLPLTGISNAWRGRTSGMLQCFKLLLRCFGRTDLTRGRTGQFAKMTPLQKFGGHVASKPATYVEQ